MCYPLVGYPRNFLKTISHSLFVNKNNLIKHNTLSLNFGYIKICSLLHYLVIILENILYCDNKHVFKLKNVIIASFDKLARVSEISRRNCSLKRTTSNMCQNFVTQETSFFLPNFFFLF